MRSLLDLPVEDMPETETPTAFFDMSDMLKKNDPDFLVDAFLSKKYEIEEFTAEQLSIIEGHYIKYLSDNVDGAVLDEAVDTTGKMIAHAKHIVLCFKDMDWVRVQLERLQTKNSVLSVAFDRFEMAKRVSLYDSRLEEIKGNMPEFDRLHSDFLDKARRGDYMKAKFTLGELLSKEPQQHHSFYKALISAYINQSPSKSADRNFSDLHRQFDDSFDGESLNYTILVVAQMNLLPNENLNLREQLQRAESNIMLRAKMAESEAAAKQQIASDTKSVSTSI